MNAIPLRLSLATCLFASGALAQINWSQLSTTGGPDPYCGYAWDTTRDVLVTFGGQLGFSDTGVTREWNGASWTSPNPAVRPSNRRRPAMAYDEARGETVLFSGGASSSNDTWTWDGTTWTQKFPATLPPIRFGAAMAYDRKREVVVMFGGFVPTGVDNNQTWEWDGTNWTLRSTPPALTARGAHRMVYDDAREAVVLVGGYNTIGSTTLADTWTYDGTGWTQQQSLPGTICDQTLVYDPTRRRVVLQGGLRITGLNLLDLNATYEWDGATWTQRTPASNPGARNGGASAWDPVAEQCVAAGGTNTVGTTYRDTWQMSPVTKASGASFGQACALTQGIQLQSDSLPYVGLPFTHEIVNASPSAAIGVLIFGISNTTWNGVPLPAELTAIGAPSCWLNVSFDFTEAVLLINGRGGLTWNIPDVPVAIGYPFFTQGLALDPTSLLPFQVDITDGRAFTIGVP